jgi:hypothetical protein
MSDCKSNTPLSACDILQQAIEAVNEAASGGAVVRIRVRDTDTTFSDHSLEARRKYLMQLVQNKAVFGACAMYGVAASLAGMPPDRSPAGIRSSRPFCDPCCSQPPAPKRGYC